MLVHLSVGRTVNAMETHEPPRWRGVNHLALIAPDMDKIVRFDERVFADPV
jgi:hypothetical protein